METNVLIVLLILFVLVVGINGGLFLIMRRGGKEGGNFEIWKRFGSSVRKNPWEKEDQDLEQLSRLMKELKDEDHN